MFNNNVTIMELYVNKDPERSDRADVVKASCTMFQGKKDDNKKPMFVTVEAWKFQGKCLEAIEKGQTIVASGSIRMDYWGEYQEKSALVMSADSIAIKAWPAKDGTESTKQTKPETRQPYPGAPGPMNGSGIQDDSDIPF